MMVEPVNPDAAGSAMLPGASTATQERASVKVWDLFVRVFHWSLVGLLMTAYLTAERYESVHNGAGYAIAGLVLLRVVWGIFGGRHARFSDFVRSPVEIAGFLRDTARLRATRYLGHNPAGGAMVVALLIVLSVVCGSGIMMASETYWGVEWVEDLHETAVHVTLVLIGLHVTGVAVTSIEHRENLIKAMFTGRKRR